MVLVVNLTNATVSQTRSSLNMNVFFCVSELAENHPRELSSMVNLHNVTQTDFDTRKTKLYVRVIISYSCKLARQHPAVTDPHRAAQHTEGDPNLFWWFQDSTAPPSPLRAVKPPIENILRIKKDCFCCVLFKNLF